MAVGIVNNCNVLHNNFIRYDPGWFCYAIDCNGGDKTFHGVRKWQKFGNSGFSTNTKMTLELNIPNKTLSVYRNNVLVGIAYQNVETDNVDYYLAVTAIGINNEVELEKMEIWTQDDALRDSVLNKFKQLETEIRKYCANKSNKSKSVKVNEIIDRAVKMLNVIKETTTTKDCDPNDDIKESAVMTEAIENVQAIATNGKNFSDFQTK